jgi:hypothetical protein
LFYWAVCSFYCATIFEIASRYFPESYQKWKDLYYYQEPIKLFNFYFKSNYETKYGELINNIFGKIENLIKPLKKKQTLKEIFSDYNRTINITTYFYFIQPILYSLISETYFTEENLKENIPNIFSVEIREMSAEESSFLFHPSLSKENILEIHKMIKGLELEISGKTLPKSPSIKSFSVDNEVEKFAGEAIFTSIDFRNFKSFSLHKNIMLVTIEFLNDLEEMFNDLKEILQ